MARMKMANFGPFILSHIERALHQKLIVFQGSVQAVCPIKNLQRFRN